ncbi:MAG: hypothetical protein LBJ37_13735 [Paucimonas sp.]|jgi:hypothetical protein|nr:hypothetical protein [Paucimonas sp.]
MNSKTISLGACLILFTQLSAHASTTPDFCFDQDSSKRKPINIVVKETQKDGMIYLDASSTTSPSGETSFAWGENPKSFTAADSKISSMAGRPGTTGGILLTVLDPRCLVRESKMITFTSEP